MKPPESPQEAAIDCFWFSEALTFEYFCYILELKKGIETFVTLKT